MGAGLVKLSEIRALLAACAPGATIQTNLHHHWVHFKEKTFRRLPLGKHGARIDPEIEIGYVRQW